MVKITLQDIRTMKDTVANALLSAHNLDMQLIRDSDALIILMGEIDNIDGNFTEEEAGELRVARYAFAQVCDSLKNSCTILASTRDHHVEASFILARLERIMIDILARLRELDSELVSKTTPTLAV